MATYPKPGRGAWTLTGGLLPIKPGSTNKAGFYRAAVEGEDPIGARWLRDRTKADHHSECVWYGVLAVQGLLGVQQDGWFGPATQQATMFKQRALGVKADGIIGPATMRALLGDLIQDICGQLSIPVEVLGGLLINESGMDPAAVGTNGTDHGLAQINLAAHPSVTLAQALDPGYALHWTAEDLAQVHAVWKGRTSVDPWTIAIASHNSPLLAKQWAVTGSAPVVKGRVFQIQEYVDKVRMAW